MKNLIAFLLSCLTIGLVVTLLAGALQLVVPNRPVTTLVYVRSSQDPSKVVAAINGLNLPHVHVQGHTTKRGLVDFIEMLFEMTISLFFTSGVVFVVFKRICRRMGIEPIV